MKLKSIVFLAGVAAGAMLLGFSSSAAAATPTVGTVPSTNTPFLLSNTPNQTVRRLVPCGGSMYAVGTISAIGQGSNTYTRNNAFSFSQTTGQVSNWNPNVNGPVNDIAFSPDCSIAYLGGKFTSAGGQSATNLAAVDTNTGALIGSFKHSATAAVYTVDYAQGQVLVGGAFSKINGAARTEFASLDPSTGSVTSYANLAISGAYPNSSKRIDNSQVSHSGNRLLVEGVFTSINGQSRQQMAVFDLGSTSLTLDAWNAPALTNACFSSETYYVRAGAWSPNDATIYGAATGYKPASGPGSNTSDPRAGLCDSAFSFSSAPAAQATQWINYTGCDSYYAVIADDSNVYVGGHERWANNPDGCDAPGPGALSRPGMADLDATTGQATSWNPTRSLGHGADDMVLTSAGLWVASDNFSDGNAQMCGGQKNHGGICFLPY